MDSREVVRVAVFRSLGPFLLLDRLIRLWFDLRYLVLDAVLKKNLLLFWVCTPVVSQLEILLCPFEMDFDK